MLSEPSPWVKTRLFSWFQDRGVPSAVSLGKASLRFRLPALICLALSSRASFAITVAFCTRSRGSGRPALDASGPAPPYILSGLRIFNGLDWAWVCASASPCVFSASLNLFSSSVNSICPEPNAGRPDPATAPPPPPPVFPNAGRLPNAGRPNPPPVEKAAPAD